MAIVILAIVGALILLDFTIIGLIPEKFGIWGSLRDGNPKKLIEDTVQYSIRTDINRKYVNSMINNRVGYKSLLLTPKAILVKNTYLTYLLKVEINSIRSYEVKNELIGKRLRLNLEIQESKKWFEFSTNKSERWVQELTNMDIPETQSFSIDKHF